MKKEKSAGAVIINDKKVLLLHYSSGHWDFPKGHIEKGETELETAKREVKEETGISDLEQIKGFKEKTYYFYKNKEKYLINKEVTYFLFKTKTKKVEISYEHTGYEWTPIKEAKNKITFNNSKEVLKKIIQHI